MLRRSTLRVGSDMFDSLVIASTMDFWGENTFDGMIKLPKISKRFGLDCLAALQGIVCSSSLLRGSRGIISRFSTSKVLLSLCTSYIQITSSTFGYFNWILTIVWKVHQKCFDLDFRKSERLNWRLHCVWLFLGWATIGLRIYWSFFGEQENQDEWQKLIRKSDRGWNKNFFLKPSVLSQVYTDVVIKSKRKKSCGPGPGDMLIIKISSKHQLLYQCPFLLLCRKEDEEKI